MFLAGFAIGGARDIMHRKSACGARLAFQPEKKSRFHASLDSQIHAAVDAGPNRGTAGDGARRQPDGHALHAPCDRGFHGTRCRRTRDALPSRRRNGNTGGGISRSLNRLARLLLL
jgi:hypothetical protein